VHREGAAALAARLRVQRRLHPGDGRGGLLRRRHRQGRGHRPDHRAGGEVRADQGGGVSRGTVPAARHDPAVRQGAARRVRGGGDLAEAAPGPLSRPRAEGVGAALRAGPARLARTAARRGRQPAQGAGVVLRGAGRGRDRPGHGHPPPAPLDQVPPARGPGLARPGSGALHGADRAPGPGPVGVRLDVPHAGGRGAGRRDARGVPGDRRPDRLRLRPRLRRPLLGHARHEPGRGGHGRRALPEGGGPVPAARRSRGGGARAHPALPGAFGAGPRGRRPRPSARRPWRSARRTGTSGTGRTR